MTDYPPETEPDSGAIARRRGPDLLTLAVGLAALTVALSALLGGMGWLPGVDIRWVLAAVAILVGLALILGSVRPRRH
ncbi:MAG: hypothetical protein LC808_38330 [Actinobacteria bacterium]|nr:hypothetical protein [Actinomycetota bacterium]